MIKFSLKSFLIFSTKAFVVSRKKRGMIILSISELLSDDNNVERFHKNFGQYLDKLEQKVLCSELAESLKECC